MRTLGETQGHMRRGRWIFFPFKMHGAMLMKSKEYLAHQVSAFSLDHLKKRFFVDSFMLHLTDNIYWKIKALMRCLLQSVTC